MSGVTLEEPTGGLALLRIDYPPVNALSAPLRAQLAEVVDQLGAPDSPYRVLIVTGMPGRFCAGADITELTTALDAGADALHSLSTSVQALFTALENLPMPVVAAIDGPAVGGGLELALACDFRVVAESVRLGLPEVGLGLIPAAGGTQRLRATVGLARSLDLILHGTLLSAARALDLGLVTRVASDGQALDAALSLADGLLRRPRVALAGAKRAVRAATRYDFATEAEQFVTAATSRDAAEGIRAFLAKERPVFSHD